MVEAGDLLGDLGVHVETCTNEASAAAMLGASINHTRAVTWKSIVGTNVAADALSNPLRPAFLAARSSSWVRTTARARACSRSAPTPTP
jgi:indolepyruvate ferredoxin oxidoreductase alpha subunit